MERRIVHDEEMAENLRLHDHLVTTEAIMMALACEEVGQQTAHEILDDHAVGAIKARNFSVNTCSLTSA